MDPNFVRNVTSVVSRHSGKPSSDSSDSNMALTLPMIGRVHIVNDSNGRMQLGFVFAYWVYGTFCTLFIVLLPQYEDGRIPYSIIVSFMIVSVMCLLSLIKASLTNPGRIPSVSEASSMDTSGWTYCKTCDRKRPQRAHHCRRCRQCVLRMDHHCPWINNCVGEENHFAFCLLLFYAFLLGTFTLSLTIFHFWIWPRCSSCDKEVFYIKHSIWFMYVLVVLAFNMALLMFLQLSHLHLNLLIDRTTLESMSPALAQETRFRKAFIAYQELCGRTSVLFWLWPCRRRIPLFRQATKSPV